MRVRSPVVPGVYLYVSLLQAPKAPNKVCELKKIFKHVRYISAGGRITNGWCHKPSERSVSEHSKILHCIDIW